MNIVFDCNDGNKNNSDNDVITSMIPLAMVIASGINNSTNIGNDIANIMTIKSSSNKSNDRDANDKDNDDSTTDNDYRNDNKSHDNGMISTIMIMRVIMIM